MTLVFAKSIDGQWYPGIGDPSFGGWLTVAAYFATAIFCIRASLNTGDSRLKWFWLATTGALVLLGINKQLDLQSWFTEVGRRVAVAGGWYEKRAAVQQVFIATIAFGGLLLMLALAGLLRRELTEIWLALLGIVFLTLFVVIRAMSFHHVDQLIGTTIAAIPVNWLLELGGITAIAVSAFQKSRTKFMYTGHG